MELEDLLLKTGKALKDMAEALRKGKNKEVLQTVVPDGGPAPFRTAVKPATPNRRVSPDGMFPRTEIAHDIFACNGYLGAGPAQHARLFLQMLSDAGVGLVVTICKWAAAECITALLAGVGIRHILLKEDASSITSWKALKPALDDVLAASTKRRVLLNGFAHTPATAMFGVALLVYSNVGIAAAVAKVQPFYQGIADACKSGNRTSAYRRMLETMEEVRMENPYITPIPEVVVDEDDAEHETARRRKRPCRIYVPEQETQAAVEQPESYMTLRARKSRRGPENR